MCHAEMEMRPVLFVCFFAKASSTVTPCPLLAQKNMKNIPEKCSLFIEDAKKTQVITPTHSHVSSSLIYIYMHDYIPKREPIQTTVIQYTTIRAPCFTYIG